RVQPSAAGVVVDLAPAGHGGGTRDVGLRVVHERDHVAARGLGAAHGGHRGEVAVGKIAREIGAEVFRGAGEHETRIATCVCEWSSAQRGEQREPKRGWHVAYSLGLLSGIGGGAPCPY